MQALVVASVLHAWCSSWVPAGVIPVPAEATCGALPPLFALEPLLLSFFSFLFCARQVLLAVRLLGMLTGQNSLCPSADLGDPFGTSFLYGFDAGGGRRTRSASLPGIYHLKLVVTALIVFGCSSCSLRCLDGVCACIWRLECGSVHCVCGLGFVLPKAMHVCEALLYVRVCSNVQCARKPWGRGLSYL